MLFKIFRNVDEIRKTFSFFFFKLILFNKITILKKISDYLFNNKYLNTF